jgi:hypothetical protein
LATELGALADLRVFRREAKWENEDEAFSGVLMQSPWSGVRTVW